MARDWVRRNRNQGNILKTSATDITEDATLVPNANINYLLVDFGGTNDTITITVEDVSKSIIGDLAVITGGNTAGGTARLRLTGAGMSDGETSLAGAGATVSLLLVFNGVNFSATVTPVAIQPV